MKASSNRTTGPRPARLTAVLLTSTMLAGVPQAMAQTVLPTGGNVAAGSAVIGTPTNGALTVTQSSSSAVVNWQSFSVGQGNAVNFVQPSSTSAILNRVTGSATSTIAGQINANGQVYLVNPNGIAITSTGTVNAAGFVASTLGISDTDFMSGKRTFTGNGASASVSNAGSITIGRGGYAALLGGSVDNAGTITVPLGKIGLGSGEQATLDLSGDGFMQVTMPTRAAGSGALVSNSGKISANGGTVQLSAAAARDMARQAINMSGTIEAKSVGGRNGAIILGGSDGAVAVSGKLNVASRKAKGGSITVTGRDIKLAGATLDASGKTGGGTIRIGGDRQGQGTLQRADTTSIDSATTIKADATQSGNGGNVIVWSDLLTTFAGNISAKGGALSGNGGEAEVSGKAKLDYSGFTDLSATNGSFGTLLLDPYNVTISSAADSGGFTAAGNDSVINVTTLQNALASANVNITTGSSGSQAGNITVAAPVAWSSPTTLTLSAANSIEINSTISVQGAGGVSLVMASDITTLPGTSIPKLSFGAGASIDYGAANLGGTLSINGNGYTLLYSMTDIAGFSGSGRAALATDLNSTTTYSGPLVFSLTGTFEGLGHSISNLTINSTAVGSYTGLFGLVYGQVRNLNLVGGSITGAALSATGAFAGRLTGGGGAGAGGAALVNVTSSASVTGGDSSQVGGLAGNIDSAGNGTLILNSSSTGAVTTGPYGSAGGLVSWVTANGGPSIITGSHATGVISGSNAYLGGLVAYVVARSGGTVSIINSYATGLVGSADGNVSGGLVGAILADSATVSVTGSFATGAVYGGVSANGGLVGSNYAGGTGGVASITDSFATGAVTGRGAASNGGLVGENIAGSTGASASISTSYATGRVTTTGYGSTGGLVGLNQVYSGTATIASSYWDTSTSGILTAGIGSDNNSQSANVTGLTTAQFQSGTLPTGFSSSVWSTGAGLYPYLTGIFANGVQAVSGFAYSEAGVTPLASGTAGAVGVTVVGGNATLGTATTGSNGYYYVFGAAGTIANGASVVAYTTVNGATGATNAARIATSTYASGTPSQTGLDIWAPVTLLAATTNATTYSAAVTGGFSLAGLPTLPTGGAIPSFLNGAMLTLAATGAGFTLDTPLAISNRFAIQTTAASAPITVSSPVTVASGAGLGLYATGALAINAPISVTGGGSVALAYDASSPTNLTFAQGSSIDYGATDLGGTLRVNSQNYALLYSMNDFQNQNTSGFNAIATNLNASQTPYTSAVIGNFYGTLEGLGHTISSLTIASNNVNVGLIGTLNAGGTIRDLGIVGGSVSGRSFVGGLLGGNLGSVTNVYATGAVSGGQSSIGLGGLIGYNAGSVTNAYATGAVSGGDNVTALGGLVGSNGLSGSVTNVYATGAVSGGTNANYVGGLVGQNDGSVTNAYATGAVSAGQSSYTVGGLVGFNFGTVTNAYWDTQTSGLGGDYTGLTTAQLQTLATVTDLGAAFAGGAGLYPYLKSFFPNGVQAFTGTAYSDAGTTPLASGVNGAVTVGLLADGTRIGNATTGANGYYYIATPLGAPSTPVVNNSQNLLAYTVSGAPAAATLATASGVPLQIGLNLYGNALTVETSATLFSQAPQNASAARTLNATALATAAGNNAAATAAINGALGLGLIATGASFTIDQSVITSNTFRVSTVAGSPLTVSSAITINNGGSLGLLSGGALAINAPVTVNGAGSVALGYDASSPTNLTFAQGASIDFGATDQGGTLSVNSQNYALLYSITDFQQQNTSGFNAIATNLDASLSPFTSAVVGTLNGTLEGLGHTISNLTITSNNANVGLIGALSTNGVIRDLGLVGGSVSGVGVPYVGSLVGHQNGGTIVNVYATVAVSGSQTVGGLVGGQDSGTISNVYATGAVSGTNYVGGLVGYQLGGMINNAYATGAVHGSGYVVGGLVGSNYVGTISNAYATGAVTASSFAGGLVGLQGSGTISNSYWDTQTSGQSISGGGTGLTTAQFQTAAAATNLGAAFAGGAGLYPYLKSFFPNGVQVVSGTAYTDSGVTPLASGANGAAYVSIASNGQTLSSVTTGANGYYYAFVPAGTLSSTGVAAYTQANVATGAKDAVSYVSGAPADITGNLDISGGWRRDKTLASSLSTLDAGFATTTSGTPVAGFTLPNRAIFAINDFVLDSALNVTGTFALASAGNVTQTAAFSAATLILEGSNGTSFTLTNTGNQFGQFAASGGAMNVYDADSLTIAASATDACNCTISGVSGDQMQIATAGDLTIASGAAVSGISPVLSAGGAFINNAGSSTVTATSGRWLVYSANPTGDTFGGLDSGNTAVWNTAAGGTVTATGNRYVFAYQPTLTVTAHDASKTYGDTSSLAGATVSGGQAGIAGAYLGDTLADIVSGTATVSSTGAAATAGAGSYDIAATKGSLTSAGYGFDFVSGTLTVGTRAITVTADSLSRIYGVANPALTYSVSGRGLVNGDLLWGALATDADSSSTAGRYAITRGSLSASANYAMIFAPGTLTVEAVINPPGTDLASTVANGVSPGPLVTAAMLPVITVPPPSGGSDSGGAVLSADPRFDGIVICGGLNCVVAAPKQRP